MCVRGHVCERVSVRAYTRVFFSAQSDLILFARYGLQYIRSKHGTVLVMGVDGNVVIYDEVGDPAFATHIIGKGAMARLVVDASGILRGYTRAGLPFDEARLDALRRALADDYLLPYDRSDVGVIRPYIHRRSREGRFSDHSLTRVREYTDAFDNGALGLVSAAQWTDLLEASERAQRARADNLVEGSTSDVSDATAFPADADFAAYDAGRFSKWSMAGNDMWATPIDPNIYGPMGVLAGVRRWQHDVEKGLSMPSIRSEFSVASGMLMRLRAFSEAALGSRSSSEVGEGALGKVCDDGA